MQPRFPGRPASLSDHGAAIALDILVERLDAVPNTALVPTVQGLIADANADPRDRDHGTLYTLGTPLALYFHGRTAGNHALRAALNDAFWHAFL